MNIASFQHYAHQAVDWTADYRQRVESLPVRSQVQSQAIAASIPEMAPLSPESPEAIIADIDKLIMPGITHWQHPRFFAYFPANAPLASVLAEQFIAGLGVQAMLWQTSPAASELEERMMLWLRYALGLPVDFGGVIQDTASTATLVALLTMREIALHGRGNASGLAGSPRLRVYANEYAHSSIEKAMGIAGMGRDNLVKIPQQGRLYGMDTSVLRQRIAADRAEGLLPCGVVASVGGTSVGSCDDLLKVAAIAREFQLYLHVDAAWAGSAMICPEFRYLWTGIEAADSIVFNPHKWLGAQFDCSAYFMKEPAKTAAALAINPEYLKTLSAQHGYNLSDFSVQLGRSFRALKIWFVMRIYGTERLQQIIRDHVRLAQSLERRLRTTEGFEICTPSILSLFTFRYRPKGRSDIDAANLELVQKINDDGRIYLTHTNFNGQIVIRFQVGHHETRQSDIDTAYQTIVELAHTLDL